MVLAIKPVVSPALAGCCTVLSVFAVVILCAFGFFFARHAIPLTSSEEEDPEDPGHAATMCYMAALVYAAFIAFCGLQLTVHKRYPRGVQL